jgi:2-iminoacetate synthase
LEDYALPETKALGEKLIREEIENIPKEKVRMIAKENLVRIGSGSRDFRF